MGGLTPAADLTLDGSLRSTASWDSAIEASLVGSNSSMLAGTSDIAVRRRRDAPFPPLAADVSPSASPVVAVTVDPTSDTCESDRSSLGGDGASPGLRRAAATDRLRGACRSVLRKVENKMKRRGGSSSPTPAAVAVALSPMEISSPTVVDDVAMRARMDALRCVDLAASCPLSDQRTGGLLQRSAPATPTNERYSPCLGGETSRQFLQQRRRQRSLDSARVSIYDNVVTSPTVVSTAAEEDPQRQLDAILSALYRDIGMLSTSLAVVDEERNGTIDLLVHHIP